MGGRAAVVRLTGDGRSVEASLHESHRDLAEARTLCSEAADIASLPHLLTAFARTSAP